MDTDRISYIFGSFARRRQSQEVNARRNALKISHDRSLSAPQEIKPTKEVTKRAKSVYALQFDETKFKCPVCRKQFEDPRVLPCLHTFCLKCIKSLEKIDRVVWYDEEIQQEDNEDDKENGKSPCTSRKTSSGGSGYLSDPSRCSLSCPTCGAKCDIPPDGTSSFPPNYPLQHRMVLATLNSRNTHLLCDLCTSDVTARFRCMDCAISFCDHCEELHLLQKAYMGHDVLTLDEARQKGITNIRRQIMCLKHKEVQVSSFCNTCLQVVCKDCISTDHKSHDHDSISKAAKTYTQNLKLASHKAKSFMEKSAIASSQLNNAAKKFEAQCNKVQQEVEKFMENYLKSIEDHRQDLLRQIQQIKDDKLLNLQKQKMQVQKQLKEARDVAYFLDDLLVEQNHVELLSFVRPILKRVDNQQEFDLHCLKQTNIQFLPREVVPNDVCNLYGMVTTQTVAAQNCVIIDEGLQNLRVGKRVEMTVETRDINDLPLERGGEQISAEVHHRDAGISRTIPVNIVDKKNGSYSINFIPDVAGKLALFVYVKGQQIKDSPFPITVRSLKPHIGTFHCCSFCSSGGSKEASCGCGGKMPGGYKGCGHGHDGHPGKRHWSCCGNVLEHSECSRSFNNYNHYQFSL